MFKHKLTISDFLLIVVNLVPLYGVLFAGWNAAMVFLVYCLETVIVGIFNVLKMAMVTVFIRPKENWNNNGNISLQPGWTFILFFIFHYGFFVFVQTQLFFGVSGLIKDGSIFGNYARIPALLGNEGKMLLFIFIAYYTMQNFFDFFRSGEYRTITLSKLMFQPYLRIVIQQLIVILGSMFLTFGAGKIFMLIMVLVKIYFEIFFNFSSILDMADKMNQVKKTDQPSK